MMNSNKLFTFTKIRRGKDKNQIFHYILFDMNISVTVQGIDMKLYMVLLHTYSEESMSQIVLFRS